MYKYPYTDDPEPKKRPEDLEDKIIRKGSKIFNTVLTVVGIIMLIMFVFGVINRYI